MQKKYYHFFYFLLSTFYFLLHSPSIANAQVGLSISPPVTEVLLAPNKSVTINLTLTNLGQDSSYNLSLHPLIPTDDLGHSTIDPHQLSTTDIPLVITPQNFELNTPYYLSANSSQTRSFKLEAASLDQAQDVYFAVVTTLSDPNTTDTALSTPAISSLVLVTITPTPAVPTDISLSPLKISPVHDTTTPININSTIKNNADIMLRVNPEVKLTSPRGDVIYQTTLDPILILGKKERATNMISIPTKLTQIGPYTLAITIKTIGGRTLVESNYTIWLLPLTLIAALLALVLTLFSLWLRRHRNP